MRKFIIYSLLAFFLLINTSYARFKSLNIKSSPNYSSIVLNADTGEVIHAVNHNKKRYPASLTKMMTLYLTFDALKKNKLGFSQSITVSKRAASMPRSNIDLKKGQRITVRQAIYALIVKSANDASIVLSEGISGNEENFVALMNKKAKELGMYDTKFQNSHGWHHDGQYTTAHDLSKLATALRRDFPGYYHLFSMKSFVYKGKEIIGHNRVLGRYKHADGLKTGYVNASGFNLATSTSKPEGKLVAIVMGGQTAKIRDDHMINLLDKGYAKLGKGKKQIRKAIVTKKNIPSKKNVFQYASIAPKKPVRYKRARSLNK